MSLDSLVVQNLDRWKEHLLDTSKRNRLLYFAPQSAVELLEPDIETLWKILVSSGKTFTFHGQQDEETLLFSEPDYGESQTNFTLRTLKSDEMRVQPRGAKLNRLLYGLRSKSNLSLAEQGLTTLYVAWGFLQWRDPYTKEENLSPLILAPMTLLRESSRAPYRLKLSEETLWLNPVLARKLASDFKISLPTLPDFEDARPLEYFDAVRAAIVNQDGWSVREAAYLGLFSFHKMAMYQDLCDGQERALRNPFVRALGGDASLLPPPIPDLPAGAALDEISPRDSFSVLDCDSSQREAIEAARAGASFVLQGPPGTGKSQTITNIIAHALADGKQVLFVSEKMAALDVVHSRLEAVGLGTFCLKAHSQNATKKEVIADLGRTLNAARSGGINGAIRQDEAESDALKRLRAGLNGYARELHARRSPLERSVYEVAGELALRAEATEIAAPLSAPFETDNATLSRNREFLRAARYSEDVWRQGDSHAWHGAKIRAFSLDLLATMRARGAQGAQLSRELLAQSRERAQLCGLSEMQFSLEQAALLPALVAALGELETMKARPPAMWFVLEDLKPHMALAAEFKTRFEDVCSREAALNARYQNAFWELPHAQLIERATTRHSATLARGGTWEKFPDWGAELGRRLDLTAQHLKKSALLSAALASDLAATSPACLAQIGALANALAILNADWKTSRAVAPNFFDAAQMVTLQSAIESARKQTQIRDDLAQTLAHYDLAALENVELGAMKTRFETQYGGFFRFLKSDYKRDLSQLVSWRRDHSKMNYETARADLAQLCAWQDARNWLQTEAARHGQLFGAGFGGQNIDWNALEANLQASAKLATTFASIGGVSTNLISRLVGGQSAPDFLQNLPALRASLLVLHEELPWLQTIFDLKDLPFQQNGIALSLAQSPTSPMAQWLQQQSAALRDVEEALGAWTSVQKVSNDAPQSLIDDARESLEIARLEGELSEESERLHAQFGALFCDENTDWNAILQLLDWTNRALDWWKNWGEVGGQTGEQGQASGAFVDLATGVTAFQLPQTSWCETQLREQWNYFAALFEHPISALGDLENDALWFENRVESAPLLEDYLRWQTLAGELKLAQLWDFWEQSRQLNLGGAELLETFEKRFWSLWLDSALAQSPALAGFAGARHEDAIAQFRRFDANALGAAQRRLGAILWGKKPVATGAKTGEIAVLQKEINKKARQFPVRKLFREIPHLLKALKPCLLMSPLSVAQFLETERAQFDLVIFDEASQICPEDAVGAIIRSQQLIVVGDRRQLPPSRFFASGAILDSEDEDDESALFESILDMCAPHLRGWMLLWHYRSRDESLISFSNQHFYEGRLITFPGPFAQSPPGRGVQLENVAGVYYRGQDPRARTNPTEATRVAQLIVEHVRLDPTRSLGVIALNATQGRAIENALYQEIARAPELESWFDSRKDEPFFIKALENVQGDERDAILLSIGYGPDESGKVSLNFGPLNKEGGERRLNVAVTRAKESLTIVSSLLPEHIDLSRTSKVGPRLLRSYLESARQGGSFSPLETNQSNEGLVDSIEAALRQNGWNTTRDIGRSALRIDIAVEHPDKRGEFLLGIECDGGDYASAPVARDRERIRPAVLGGMGWKLERVWSLDWLKNPAAELERLENSLAAALQNESSPLPEVSIPEEIDFSENVEALVELESALSEPAPLPSPEKKPAKTAKKTYKSVDLGYLGWQEEFRELNAHSPKLHQAMLKVAETEAPIHRDALILKVARAWDFGRAGAQVASKIEAALRTHQSLEMRGHFVWNAGQTEAPFRVPKPYESPRPIEQIAPEEIGDAMLFCVNQAIGLERDDLIRQTAKTLGFNRTGAQINATVGAVLQSLLQKGELSERAGAIGAGDVL